MAQENSYTSCQENTPRYRLWMTKSANIRKVRYVRQRHNTHTKYNTFTYSFCWHKTGLWSLMYTASSTSRWKWFCARATTEKRSNIWEHTANRQSWLDLRWRVIAESERESANCLARTSCSSAGSDSTPPPRPALVNARPALIKVNGTCCLIFSLNLWVVLPMYLRSHTQVKEYTKLLKMSEATTGVWSAHTVSEGLPGLFCDACFYLSPSEECAKCIGVVHVTCTEWVQHRRAYCMSVCSMRVVRADHFSISAFMLISIFC